MSLLQNSLAFVVQGPELVEGGKSKTRELLVALQNYFPAAQFVYACTSEPKWMLEGCDIVVSEDPGAVDFGSSYLKNILRQQVNTLAGLEKVTCAYAIKIRSDFYVCSKILRMIDFGEIAQRISHALNERKIITFNFDFQSRLGLIDDRLQMGRVSDLKALWEFDAVTIYNRLQEDHKDVNWLMNQCAFSGEGPKAVAPEQIIYTAKFGYLFSAGCGLIENYKLYVQNMKNSFHILFADDVGLSSPRWQVCGPWLRAVHRFVFLGNLHLLGAFVASATEILRRGKSKIVR